MIKSLFCILISVGFSKDIKTNEVIMQNAPDWLTQNRVERVTDKIQQRLEWSTRRIQVFWYKTFDEYSKAQSLGPQAMAVTAHMGDQAAVHLGPKVTQENFDSVFGHELVHVIISQKYKGAIPKWLEEGLANHLAQHGKVDYQWLASKPFPPDVKELAHPFSGSADGIYYRYVASQAFAEMLQKKCELDNLIRLSVQRKLEDYLVSYCEMKDINAAFRDWVKKKAKG